MTIEIKGIKYELAATLRVAYKVQGQHNHKAYSEVFKDLGNMTIEEQIDILFAAFECANPGCKEVTRQSFLDYYLDNVSLKAVMEQLKEIIEGITGEKLDEAEAQSAPVGGRGN